MAKDYSRALEKRNPITGELIGTLGVEDIEDSQKIKELLQDIIDKENDDYTFDDFNQIKTLKVNETGLTLNGAEPKAIGSYSDYAEFFKHMEGLEVLDIKSKASQLQNVSMLVNKKPNLKGLKLDNIKNLENLVLSSNDLEELDLRNLSNLQAIYGLKDASKLKSLSIRFDIEFNPKLFDHFTLDLQHLLNSRNSLKEIVLPFNMVNNMSMSMINRIEALSEKGLKAKFLDDNWYEIDLNMMKSLLEFKENYKDMLQNMELTDIEKAAIAHTYLSENVSYSHDKLKVKREIISKLKSSTNSAEKEKYTELKRKVLLTTQTAHAALIDKSSVCAGYASAFVFLINTMGLKGKIILVDAGQGTERNTNSSAEQKEFKANHEIAAAFVNLPGSEAQRAFDGENELCFDPTWDEGKDITQFKYFGLKRENMAKVHRFKSNNGNRSEEIPQELKMKALVNAKNIINGKEREYETFEMTVEVPVSIRQMNTKLEQIENAYEAAIKSGNTEKASRMIGLKVKVKDDIENKTADYNGINLQNLTGKEDILNEVISKTESDKAFYIQGLKYGIDPHQIEKDVVVTSKVVEGREVNEIYVIDSKEKEVVSKYQFREVKSKSGDTVRVVESEESKEQYLLHIQGGNIELVNNRGNKFTNKVSAVRKNPLIMQKENEEKMSEKYGERIQLTFERYGKRFYVIAPECESHIAKDYNKQGTSRAVAK